MNTLNQKQVRGLLLDHATDETDGGTGNYDFLEVAPVKNGEVERLLQDDGNKLGLSTGSNEYEDDQYFFTTDHLGSSSFITDPAGVIIQHMEYMAFGQTMVDHRRTLDGQNPFNTPYRFNGKEEDCETGLHYYGARYYDGRVGRWMSIDPLADQFASVSPYVYTLNNPISLVDPDGRAPTPPGAKVGIERTANGNFSHYSVSATVYVYGPASSSGVAKSLNTSVNSIWNNRDRPAGTSRYSHQKRSPVKFDINFVHVDQETAAKLAENNTDRSVNFMRIVDQDGADSFFEGNSGQLNLQMDRERGNTTSAHEIGHMMGFNNPYGANDNSHIQDDAQLSGDIPLMYSDKIYFNKLNQRVRTQADVDGLNIWNAVNGGDGYIGDPNNNEIISD